MDSDDNPNRYNIVPEHPKAALKTFQEAKMKTEMYGQKLEQKARKESTAGGNGGKMTVNAVADPSELIEDPELKHANMLDPDTTPLLMQEPNVPLPGNDGPHRRENYKPSDLGMQVNEPVTDDKKYIKWAMYVLVIGGLFALVYLYVTRQIDPYVF
jgi:crotonobetainyl-CoA:carnitine CoA-transferase CaiB-like acyl-CoA transferase